MCDGLFNIMCDIEDYLISIIDSDPNYGNYSTADEYFESKGPEFVSLYQCFKVLSNKYEY